MLEYGRQWSLLNTNATVVNRERYCSHQDALTSQIMCTLEHSNISLQFIIKQQELAFHLAHRASTMSRRPHRTIDELSHGRQHNICGHTKDILVARCQRGEKTLPEFILESRHKHSRDVLHHDDANKDELYIGLFILFIL